MTALILAIVYAGVIFGMKIIPSSLEPGEDQKVFLMTIQMPNGTSQARSIETGNEVCAKQKAGIPVSRQ
jgi:multidrug efflux pump subunit AcrB